MLLLSHRGLSFLFVCGLRAAHGALYLSPVSPVFLYICVQHSAKILFWAQKSRREHFPAAFAAWTGSTRTQPFSGSSGPRRRVAKTIFSRSSSERVLAGVHSDTTKHSAVSTAACAIPTLEYAKTRRQFGKRIVDFQGLSFIIADMYMRLEACRALLYESLVCARDNVASNLPLIVKPYISDNVMQICTDAVQVLGGYGYMKEYPVERYMREAKIFQIFGGTNQIKRKNLMKVLAGKDTGK